MGQRISSANKPGRQLLYSIGIFALVGIGLGIIGLVVLTELAGGNSMTNAIFSGILSIIILVIALFLGPVVATVVGIQIGNHNRSLSGYLTSFIGNSAGYIMMMLIVLGILSVGIALVSSGGGTGTIGSTSTGGNMSSSAGGFGQWLFPIIAISIITGLTGTGASYLQTQISQTGPTRTEGISNSIPVRGIFVAVLVCILLLGGVYGASTLFNSNPSSNLEVNGNAYSQNEILYGDVIVENIGNNEATATLTVRLVLDGQVNDDFTSSREITVASGESVTGTLRIGQYSDLSRSEIDALNSGNWTIEFLINGEVRDTYTE